MDPLQAKREGARSVPPEAGAYGQLSFVALEPHYVIASWHRVGLAVWVDDTPVEAIREAQAMLAQLAQHFPEGIGFFQVIGEDNQVIEPDSRLALKELLRSGRSFLREAPVVYEGAGFRAASIRAIVTGLLSPRSYGFRHRVYSTLEDGARALAQQFEKREPSRYARCLCEVLAHVRDCHRDAFPSAPRSFIRYRG